MGGVGSDVAIEAADVVLMSDDITAIAKAIDVSHYTNFILKENVTFTLIIKIGVLILTLFGLTNMWMGVFADVGVTLIAICNSMRILYKKSLILTSFLFLDYTLMGEENESIRIYLLPLISLIVLFFLTKLMGYRQVTELSLYDYIIGITIGSIASELIMCDFEEILKPLLGMIVYAVFTWLISILTKNYMKFRFL